MMSEMMKKMSKGNMKGWRTREYLQNFLINKNKKEKYKNSDYLGVEQKKTSYKIVVADSKFPRDGRFIEKLGFFNPLLPKEQKVELVLVKE